MKKTIKIIDLLNLIANGEEVPNKIMYGLTRWYYDNNAKDYFKDSNNTVSFQMTYVSNPKWLNIEVLILDEEEFEDIEIINVCLKKDGYMVDKINQLIKNQKKIIERLDNDR